MHKAVLSFVVFAGACGVCAGQQGPYLMLETGVREGGGIVAVEVPVEEIAAALGVAADTLHSIRAFADTTTGLVAVTAQSRVDDDGVMHIAIQLPPGLVAGRFQVHFGAGDSTPAAGGPSVPTVEARTEQGVTIVRNGFVEVVHDPAQQGGLPSKVTFLHSGQAFEDFILNDRLYRKDLGQFGVCNDKNASVTVLDSGPVEATVEVRCLYVMGDQIPPSNPKAVYRFVYRAGTPAIEVSVHAEQQTGFEWNEHHLMEWNFPQRPLNNWAGGTPRQAGAFAGDKEEKRFPGWAALTDGVNVFGLLSSQVLLYSGTPSYGSYIHGPWTPWNALEHDASCTLWLDSRPEALDQLEAAATAPYPASRVRLTTPAIEALRERVQGQVAALPEGEVRDAHYWWFSLTERLVLAKGLLSKGRTCLEAQAAALSENAGVDAIAVQLVQAAGASAIQRTGRLGVLWGGPEHAGSPLSVYMLREHKEILSGLFEPIWRLDIEGTPSGAESWAPGMDRFACTVSGPPESTAIVWRGKDSAAGIEVRLESAIVGDALSMKLRVVNESSGVSINQAVFPSFAFGQLGDDAADDVFFRPTVSGRLVRAPLMHGIEFRGNYPSGWGSLPFMAHWDADCGIYCGIHDPKACTKNIVAKRAASDAAILASVEWPAPDATRPGNDFEHPGLAVLAPLNGDWFDAAQRYRGWAEKEAEWWPYRGQWGRPDTPAWMKEVCVWALASGGPDAVVGPVSQFAEYMGVPAAVHWYNWHEIPFDDNYPHYFPTKPGFAEGVAALQKAGVRVMPYINGRLWDSDTDDFLTIALPAATKDRDGTYYTEEYGSKQKLAPMCPTQQVWQDKVQEIVLRLIGPECNVDGVYIDQVAAAAPRLCFDASHGHLLSGGHWWTTDGYWPMLTRLQETMAAQHPEKMLTTECSAEPYLQCFDGYLTWHYQDPEAVPAVAAVCSGKIQFFGRSMNGAEALAHRMRVAQALVFGEQLWWGPPDIIEKQPETAAFLRRCARVRHHLLPYLAEGRLARPPAVRGEIPQVTANWAWSGEWPVTDSALQCGAWQAEDGSVAFVFANSTEQPIQFTWQLTGASYGFTSESVSVARVAESGREAAEPQASMAERTVELAGLGVEAFVVSR